MGDHASLVVAAGARLANPSRVHTNSSWKRIHRGERARFGEYPAHRRSQDTDPRTPPVPRISRVVDAQRHEHAAAVTVTVAIGDHNR
ncbi:hypothetical protein [Salinispora arenicola]|uniref:hypothetical protein n=1 Tax=Salinispora arenicola TaxID=168697 RepID=UPI0003A22A91|nr:hypothetical protein [Salinispora arenicola]